MGSSPWGFESPLRHQQEPPVAVPWLLFHTSSTPHGARGVRSRALAVNLTPRRSFSLRTTARTCLVDITSPVQAMVQESGIRECLCWLFCPHTTAGLTINEGADPDVAADIVGSLSRLVPAEWAFRHAEGNADAHVKAALVGGTLCLSIESGRVVVGRWQRVFFCEFDGPRQREIWVRLMGT